MHPIKVSVGESNHVITLLCLLQKDCNAPRLVLISSLLLCRSCSWARTAINARTCMQAQRVVMTEHLILPETFLCHHSGTAYVYSMHYPYILGKLQLLLISSPFWQPQRGFARWDTYGMIECVVLMISRSDSLCTKQHACTPGLVGFQLGRYSQADLLFVSSGKCCVTPSNQYSNLGKEHNHPLWSTITVCISIQCPGKDIGH